MSILAHFYRRCTIRRSMMPVVEVMLLLQLPLVAVFSMLSIVPAYAAGGAASFSIQPSLYDPANPTTRSYYILNLKPGTVTTVGIRVLNTGTATGSVSLYPVDATTGATSGTVFRLHSDPRKDVGAWITLNTQQLTLAPGQSQILPFQITVPQDARAGQHLGGIVAEGMDTQTTSTQNQHFQMNVRHLFVMAVQVTLPGATVEQLTATGIQAGGANSYQNLQLQLSNTGTVMVQGHGSLRVTDASGALLQNVPIKLDTFLPDTSIAYPVNVQHKALVPGDYQAVLDLTYGHNQTLHYVTKFTITSQQVSQVFQQDGPLQGPVIASTIIPVWELALIGLLFLGGLLFVWQNLRRFSKPARKRATKLQH